MKEDMYVRKEDVHIRVSKGVMRRVRAYAQQRGLTLVAAITVLLDRALEEEE